MFRFVVPYVFSKYEEPLLLFLLFPLVVLFDLEILRLDTHVTGMKMFLSTA